MSGLQEQVEVTNLVAVAKAPAGGQIRRQDRQAAFAEPPGLPADPLGHRDGRRGERPADAEKWPAGRNQACDAAPLRPGCHPSRDPRSTPQSTGACLIRPPYERPSPHAARASMESVRLSTGWTGFTGRCCPSGESCPSLAALSVEEGGVLRSEIDFRLLGDQIDAQARAVPDRDVAVLHDRVRQPLHDLVPPVRPPDGILEGDEVVRQRGCRPGPAPPARSARRRRRAAPS